MYEARFLTDGHDVFSKVRFLAAHDEAAVRHANAALRTGIGMGHEIWQESRLVHQETYVADAYEATPEAPKTRIPWRHDRAPPKRRARTLLAVHPVQTCLLGVIRPSLPDEIAV